MIQSRLNVKKIIISGGLSLLLIFLGLVGFAWQYDEHGNVNKIQIKGSSMVLHRGNGYKKGSQLVVTEADKQRRVRIISEQVSFRAEDYPFMAWTFSKLGPRTDVWVGWVTKQNPHNLNTIPAILPLDSTAVYRMKDNPEWIGDIIALGFGFDGQMHESFTLDSIELRPYSIASMLESIWDEWTAFRGWSQRTINSVEIGAQNSLIKPVLIVAAWVFISICSAMLTTFITQNRIEILLIFLLIGWGVMDVLWQVNILRQNGLSYHLYSGKSLEDKILSGVDASLYELKKEIVKCSEKKKRITFVSNDFYMTLKVKYFLLPRQPWHVYTQTEDKLRTIDNIKGTCFFITKDIMDVMNIDNDYKELSNIMKVEGTMNYKNTLGVV